MRPLVLALCVLCLLVTALPAITEQEPNDSHIFDNVYWCDNGSHNGVLSHPADIDFWYYEGWPEEASQIRFIFTPGAYLDVKIYDVNIVEVASVTSTSGILLISPTATVQDRYYVQVTGPNFEPLPYTMEVSGLFLSFYSAPLEPTGFSIVPGSLEVSPDATGLDWTWGDGSGYGNWNFYWGTTWDGLESLFFFPETVTSRQGHVDFPTPLAGMAVYYFAITCSNFAQVPYYSPVYYFVTAPLLFPTPFTEDFDDGLGGFFNLYSNNPWMAIQGETGNPGGVYAIPATSGEAILMESGQHDLSSVTAATLSFRHACLLSAETDHGYVEYSTDGGYNWYIFPASSYRGTGIYDTPLQNNPEGPCFDQASYPLWSSYTGSGFLNGYLVTDTFDLSPWAGCEDFRVGYRAVWDGESGGMGWYIDDFSISIQAPGVPHTPLPVSGTTGFGTFETINWTGINSSSYDLTLHTDPGFPGFVTLSANSYPCVDLAPNTTYFWKVRGHNSVGTSDWSPVWSFTTGSYRSTRHNASSLWISEVSFGSINNSSGWNGYTYYSGIGTNLTGGSSTPIQVSLAGGYGPEAVGVWIDLDRDHVFGSTPAEFTQLAWNGSGFGGNIVIPPAQSPGPTRMRIQGIHTDNTDVLTPTGIFNFGETEDYDLQLYTAPTLSISPSSGDFPPTMQHWQSSPIRFTFSNIGSGSLDITLTGITGTDADCFNLSEGNAYPIHLTTNQASVDISYLPIRTGTHNASLLVRDNLSRTDHLIPLIGLVIEPNPLGAISFSGGNENIVIASAPPLQTNTAITIETWFRWDVSGLIQFICSKAFEELEIHTTTVQGLRFIPTYNIWLDSQPNILVPGTWQHIACVYDPASLLARIYVDGRDVTAGENGPGTIGAPFQNTGQPFRLGIRASGDYPLNGALDETRIWDRALSQDEIRNLIHLRQEPGAPNLIANWRMNELNSERIWDQVNGLHGQMVNMEPQDRITSEVLIGTGTASTLTLDTPGQSYPFGDTGITFIPDQLQAPGAVTVTHLDVLSGPDAFGGGSWTIRQYDSLSRSADLLCEVNADVSEGLLPAGNFILKGRTPYWSPAWNTLLHASWADPDLDLLRFDALPLTAQHLSISWQRLALNIPQNLVIGRDATHVTLSWNGVAGATGYRVLSSDAPDGPFNPDLSGSFNASTWTAPLGQARRFYRVQALAP